MPTRKVIQQSAKIIFNLGFHEVAFQGPLFICTCCEQSQYYHSVVCIDKLIQCNPDIDKYLGYMTSVDDIEWVGKTCHNNLVKNRNPACAVINGLVFQ